MGRALAWRTGAVLADLTWPSEPARLASEIGRLRWYRWEEGGGSEEGWSLRLAVEDPEHGWAAAIGAADILQDEADEEPPPAPT